MTRWISPQPVDPHLEEAQWGYRDIRYHTSERERELMEARSQFTWHHARPWSIFVAAMGYHWKPGSWQKVTDMVHYTQAHGFYDCMLEIMDRCKEPYDALGAMRNEAIMKARQGFEFLLYVDNDVLPEPDTLIRLLRHDQPIVAPYVEEPGTGKPLHGPFRPKGAGLQRVRWCVLSMLLFKTSVFAPFIGGEFWNNAIGADEGYHFQKLWDVGHSPYLDTDIILPVYQPPTYPLAYNRASEAEAKSFWDSRREWLLAKPDRAPIDPDDPRQQNGEYMAWMALPEPPRKGHLITEGGT